jgi:lipopolysaccharide export LptBFGC system permease protein LptF
MHNIIHSLALASALITPLGTIAETVNDEQFVQIAISDYIALTNQIHAMWIYANSTEQGRVSLHGKRVSRIIDTESKTVTLEYADGYRFIESMKPQEVRQIEPKKETAPTPRKKPSHMSDEQWKFVQRAETISSKTPKRVNAVFGPGGKVKSVTEAK